MCYSLVMNYSRFVNCLGCVTNRPFILEVTVFFIEQLFVLELTVICEPPHAAFLRLKNATFQWLQDQ